MQSERYLTFLDRENSSMMTVLPHKNFHVQSKQISKSCSMAAMHPSRDILALCSAGELEHGVQIYDL